MPERSAPGNYFTADILHLVYQTDLEDLDVLAYREYLIREKLCENLSQSDDEITPHAEPPSTTSTASYWDRAKHIIELLWWQMRMFDMHAIRYERSQSQATPGVKVYRNLKNLKALCTQGKECHCGVVFTSRWEFSVKCPERPFV